MRRSLSQAAGASRPARMADGEQRRLQTWWVRASRSAHGLLRRLREEPAARHVMLGSVAVNLPHQVRRQRDVEAHALGVDLREVEIDEEPEPTLIRGVSRQLLYGCGRRNLHVLAFEMHLDRFLRQARKPFQAVSRREASGA